jgi:hypothetical protein
MLLALMTVTAKAVVWILWADGLPQRGSAG